MTTRTIEMVKPRINEQGVLIIPFTSDPKYYWWNGGQSLDDTLRELQVDHQTMERYCSCCGRDD